MVDSKRLHIILYYLSFFYHAILYDFVNRYSKWHQTSINTSI